MKLLAVSPTLRVRDLDRSIGFYTGELGFTVAGAWPEEAPSFCILDHGEVRLMLTTDDWEGNELLAMSGQLHFDVGRGADSVEELHRRLAGRYQVLWGPEVYGYGRREFSVRDPDGYRLVFSEITDDPPTCPGV